MKIQTQISHIKAPVQQNFAAISKGFLINHSVYRCCNNIIRMEYRLVESAPQNPCYEFKISSNPKDHRKDDNNTLVWIYSLENFP